MRGRFATRGWVYVTLRTEAVSSASLVTYVCLVSVGQIGHIWLDYLVRARLCSSRLIYYTQIDKWGNNSKIHDRITTIF